MGLTTICTIQQGEPSATGTDSSYYQLWHSPGEPHRRRLDLVPDAPLAKSRLSLLQFVQITDLHIQDHESPGRMEIVSNNNDTLSIFSAMIDHAAQPNPHDNDGLWRLAALHRELAANDPHANIASGRGGQANDRNVELVLRVPFPIGRGF